MELELTDDQQTVLRLCCEAATGGEAPYWEAWFSPRDVLGRYAVRENRRESDLALVLQSLINQGYLVLPPAERSDEQERARESFPASCQVTGLGFEKYAEATFPAYLDWVEAVSDLLTSAEAGSHEAIAERLGIDPALVAHILRYHELV